MRKGMIRYNYDIISNFREPGYCCHSNITVLVIHRAYLFAVNQI